MGLGPGIVENQYGRFPQKGDPFTGVIEDMG